MSDTTTTKQVRRERREFDRVQDAVALQISRLHELPAAGEAKIQQVEDAPVRRVYKYDIDGYAEVKRDYPAVANYVDELEERIREFLLDGAQPTSTPTHKVSLSASGMAFADDMLLYPGEVIGINVTLFPSATRISCDARILSAGEAPEVANGEKHTYRLQFVRISDADKAFVDSHVRQLLNGLPAESE